MALFDPGNLIARICLESTWAVSAIKVVTGADGDLIWIDHGTAYSAEETG